MGSLVFISGQESAPTTVSNVYVATTGSDANSGLTPTSPKLTVAGAYALLPAVQTSPFVVHFASGSYVYTSPADVTQSEDAFICLSGDGAGQVGDDGFSVTLTDTVLAGSTTTVINATVALTASELVGQTIEFTSGALTGVRRSVKSNTTTTITMSAVTASAAVAGVTYKIVRPAVIFTGLAAGGSVNNLNRMSLRNIRFNTGANFIITGNKIIEGYGVEIAGAATQMRCAEGNLFFGRVGGNASAITFFAQVNIALGLTLAANQYNGWGLMNTDVTTVLGLSNVTPYLEFSAFVCFRTSISVSSSGLATIPGGSCAGFISTGTNVQLLIGNVDINGFWNISRDVLAHVNGAVVVTVTGTDAALIVQGIARLLVFGGGASLTINSTANTTPMQLSGVTAAISNLTITCNQPGQCLALTDAAKVIFSGGGTVNLSNPNVSGDGITARSSSIVDFENSNPTISAGRYGINLRGGGVANFGVQPSNVVGGTADFTVGTAGGEDFSDATLAASLSFKTNTAGSIAQRSI